MPKTRSIYALLFVQVGRSISDQTNRSSHNETSNKIVHNQRGSAFSSLSILKDPDNGDEEMPLLTHKQAVSITNIPNYSTFGLYKQTHSSIAPFSAINWVINSPRIVHLIPRPYQVYYFDNNEWMNITQVEGLKVCRTTVPLLAALTTEEYDEKYINILFFCSKICCNIDCCEINRLFVFAIILAVLLVITSIIFLSYLLCSRRMWRRIRRKFCFWRKYPMIKRGGLRRRAIHGRQKEIHKLRTKVRFKEDVKAETALGRSFKISGKSKDRDFYDKRLSSTSRMKARLEGVSSLPIM